VQYYNIIRLNLNNKFEPRLHQFLFVLHGQLLFFFTFNYCITLSSVHPPLYLSPLPPHQHRNMCISKRHVLQNLLDPFQRHSLVKSSERYENKNNLYIYMCGEARLILPGKWRGAERCNCVHMWPTYGPVQIDAGRAETAVEAEPGGHTGGFILSDRFAYTFLNCDH
jgi:hypothetical protein